VSAAASSLTPLPSGRRQLRLFSGQIYCECRKAWRIDGSFARQARSQHVRRRTSHA